MRKFIFLFIFVLGSQVTMSCSEDVDETSNEERYDFLISLYASNGKRHQSAASYGDYALFVTNLRNTLYFYNLKTKSLLCEKRFDAVTEMIGKYVLYHCNQMSFGTRRYAETDPFPLLYISQRARSDNRCIVEVYRLLPEKNNSDDYTALDATLVQTIYFPIMTMENALGRVNVAFDNDNGRMYCYSYSTVSEDPNYGQCRISQLTIPNIYEKEVFMSDDDIIESFGLEYSGINSQGGCIKDGVLFIGQGLPGVGYIYLNIVDLKKRKLVERVDLLGRGIIWEPEGCFIYNGNVMIAEGTNIWEFKLIGAN